MAKGDKAKASDTKHFGLRLREEQRVVIEAAANANGRSMNAEIIHRLEEYERVSQSYALFSEFPEVRRACQLIASIGHHAFSYAGVGAMLWKDREPRAEDFHRAIGMHFYNPKSTGVMSGLHEDDSKATDLADHAAEPYQMPSELAVRSLARARILLKEMEDHSKENMDLGEFDFASTLHRFLADARTAIDNIAPRDQKIFLDELAIQETRAARFPSPEVEQSAT